MEVDEPSEDNQMTTFSNNSPFSNTNLVEPRPSNERAVVSARHTDRKTPDELIALASQLTTARELVKGRACDRLKQIAEQMEELHLQAKRVLEDASRDEDLHMVPCNMEKQPGRLYHLYRRADGYRYFSMLNPSEWQKLEKQEEYVGSFRLEYDRSWTPWEETADRDRKYAQMQNLLKSGPSALGWRN